MKTIEEKLEEYKRDLAWQLTFEDMDWEHFIWTVNEAKEIADELKEEHVG